MSAPSMFDRLVAQYGKPPSRRRVQRPIGEESDRRSSSAAAVLSREYDALCRTATDHLEIAAGLEAAGLSDRHARDSYHADTIFKLASDLFTQVPRRTPLVAAPSPWERPRRELMARGLVYALPGLLLVGTVQHLVSMDAVLLILVTVAAAGVNQALSRLYYPLVWRKKPAEAAALLHWAIGGSVVGADAVAWLALRMGAASLVGAAVAALAATYLVSATVVLLLDRHKLLLRLLAPAVALSLMTLLVPQHLLPRPVVVLSEIASVACVFGALYAAWHLAGNLRGPAEPVRVTSLTRTDVASCLPPFWHGLLSMGLLSLIPLASVRTGSGAPGALGPVMLPAMLSLGVAEVHLYGFRHTASSLLAGHHLIPFARAIRLHLLSRLASYALLLVALSALVTIVGHRSLQGDANATGHLATYLLLCVALLVAAMLVSTGHLRTVVLIEAAAILLDVSLAHLPLVEPLTSATVHLASATALAAAVLATGWQLLGRVVSYR